MRGVILVGLVVTGDCVRMTAGVARTVTARGSSLGVLVVEIIGVMTGRSLMGVDLLIGSSEESIGGGTGGSTVLTTGTVSGTDERAVSHTGGVVGVAATATCGN